MKWQGSKERTCQAIKQIQIRMIVDWQGKLGKRQERRPQEYHKKPQQPTTNHFP